MATATTITPPPAGTDLDGLAARLGGKIRKWKDAATQAQKERDDAKAEIDGLKKQVIDLSGKADGNEAAKQRDTAIQQLREFKHQLKFTELAKAAGAKSDAAIKDLLELTKYKPETEEPDEKTIKALLATQKKERDYLFGQVQAQGQEARPAAGSGKGSSDADNQGQFFVTREQARDPAFMRVNAGKIAQAQKEGRFSLEDLQLTR